MKKLVFVVLMCLALTAVGLAGSVPAVFILGDSTADTGTNNFLNGSSVRADFPYYGIDFPHSRPTGRFSNGLNTADFLAKLYGFKRSPIPYFVLRNNTKLLHRHSFRGVNFASAGSGILQTTGQKMENGKLSNNTANVVTLTEQLEQFNDVYSQLKAIEGPAKTATFLAKSLFFISVGSNDLLAYYHYFKSNAPKDDFVYTLAFYYQMQLTALYGLGARKFGIISVPPIGCCPSQRANNTNGECVDELNQLAIDFYSAVKKILIDFRDEYKDVIYSLGNAYEMTINVINNPTHYGFKEVKTACCGTGKLNGESFCFRSTNLCSNRDEYLFWDWYHPTQAASRLAASTLYYGGPQFVTPINFKQLAEA